MEMTVGLIVLILSLFPYCGLSGATMLIERTVGTNPDKFSISEICSNDTCSRLYGAELVTEGSCQCICPSTRPTFSLRSLACVEYLQECRDLALVDENLIFAFMVNEKYDQITPSVPVIIMNKTEPYKEQAESCLKDSVDMAAYYESVDGFVELTSHKFSLVKDEQNRKYIEIERTVNDTQQLDIDGMLLKVYTYCKGLNSTLCLPMKVSGMRRAFTADAMTKQPSSTTPLQKLQPLTIITVGGCILGALILVAVAAVIFSVCKKLARSPMDHFHVDRMQRVSEVKSNRKRPLQKVFRNLSMVELQPAKYQQKMRLQSKRKSWPTSVGSIDSGRGKSRSPSTTPPKDLVDEAYAEAVLEFETSSLAKHQHVRQPSLFKIHTEKLTTVHQGINSVPGGEARLDESKTKKKFFPLKRLFSRKPVLTSDVSGSQLSIDYDQFHIAPAPRSKKFNDSFINPDVSFSEEGKLPHHEEMTVLDKLSEMSTGIKYIENELYEPHSQNGTALPVTSIDDVDLTSDFEIYEHVIPATRRHKN